MINVNCLCLKGFGNNLINALVKRKKVKINKIYTRKTLSDKFYYPIGSIEEIASENGISIQYVDTSGDWELDPCDLVICSTFHRILKAKHIKSARHIVNIHPSLLPSYKGATPTNWQVYDNVQITGVSAHLITSEEVDSGPVIARSHIFNPSLADWHLRFTLARLSEFLIDRIIDPYPNYTFAQVDDSLSVSGCLSQTEKKARSEDDATYLLGDIKSLSHLGCLIRAFDNYPNLRIKVDNRTFMVSYVDFKDLASFVIGDSQINLPGEWVG